MQIRTYELLLIFNVTILPKLLTRYPVVKHGISKCTSEQKEQINQLSPRNYASVRRYLNNLGACLIMNL